MSAAQTSSGAPTAPAAPDHHQPLQTEYGVVREIDHGARYGIEITVPGACDTCAIKGNCYGTGAMVWATSHEPLDVGDQVRLQMRRGTVLKATAWVYGIPLVAIVLGILAGYMWLFAAQPEQPRVLLSFALGVGLMAAAGFLLARLNTWVAGRLTIRAVKTVTDREHRSQP
jgi:sigma-E factor negative regulatory protein RseC